MYQITVKYVIPSLGLMNDFNIYSNTLLAIVENKTKDFIIQYIKQYEGVTCLAESITYAKIEKVELIKGLVYAEI